MIKHNKDIYEENGLFIQKEMCTCGHASIINIQRMMGVSESTMDELAKLIEIQTDGTLPPNENIPLALKELGFNIEVHENSSLSTVKNYIENGFYVISNYINRLHNDVGHFTVIENIDNSAVYLRDSALGFVRIRIEHYDALWHSQDGKNKKWFVAIKPKDD